MKQDIQTYILNLRGVQNIWIVLLVLIFDFILQNLLLCLYLSYFCVDPFVNSQSKYVFLILVLLYLIVTEVINFVSILARRWNSESERDHVGSKLLLAIFSLFHAHYLFIAFGPRFSIPMSYAYVAGMQSSQVAMKAS